MENNYIFTHEETLNIENTLTKSDGVIAFPTDTVYGLGCLIENEKAVQKIYDIKERSSQKPLILLGCSIEVLQKYVKFIPEKAKKLIKNYWPGELTIILPKSRYVPEYINSNLDTIGIRVPNHPLTIELLKRCTSEKILATTSANISNRPDLTSFNKVKTAIGNKVDYLIEDYEIPITGTPSTVIAINKDNSIHILRQGSIVID